MRSKFLFIISILLLGNILAKSQTSDCSKDFDYLINTIRTDYPGYHDKITNATLPKLLDLENMLRKKIIKYPDSCGYYLNVYSEFFKDLHLRVRRIRSKSVEGNEQPQLMQISTYGRNFSVNLDSLQQATANSKGIEGIWQGFRDELAIIKQGDKKYAVVVVKIKGWQAGQVIGEYLTMNDSVFEVTNYSLVRDRKTYKTKASLHLNGKIVEIHGDTRYVRKSNSAIFDMATLYSYTPLFPNGVNTYPASLYLSDSTYYLRIPGFHDNTANDFVKKHWKEISSRPNLIIDIRYNGGGQDNYYEELAKIIYTKPYESKGVEWYASKGNIQLFEDAIAKGEIRDGEAGLKWTKELVAAMKKNVGGFVTRPENKEEEATSKHDSVYPMPRNVGIIINDGNASSAEQFLLAAKESDKVTLFGNCNTAGVLDYSNVTPRSLPSGNYQLWCPMTRSKRLPENPIDNIGIAPNVIIPFPATSQLYDKLDSWVYFVKNYLELLGN
ncbi:MAG: S41 family peptidase [Prolixibacteraceae bacterium]